MNIIKENYENIITRMRNLCGETRDFSVSVKYKSAQGFDFESLLIIFDNG